MGSFSSKRIASNASVTVFCVTTCSSLAHAGCKGAATAVIDRTDFEMKLRRDASSDVLEVSRHDLMHGFGDATKNPVQGQTNAQHDIRSMSSSRLLGDVQAPEDVADVDIVMLLLLKSISGCAFFLLGCWWPWASDFQVSMYVGERHTQPASPRFRCLNDQPTLPNCQRGRVSPLSLSSSLRPPSRSVPSRLGALGRSI